MALTDEGMGTTMLMQPAYGSPSLFDELMTVLQAVYPRLYSGVMSKI